MGHSLNELMLMWPQKLQNAHQKLVSTVENKYLIWFKEF